MATGLTSGERNGSLAIFASDLNGDPKDLPSSNSKVLLSYPKRLTEDELLSIPPSEYVSLAESKRVDLVCPFSERSLIFSDNLRASLALMRRPKKATLIYMDPPFATGMHFHARSQEHAYSDVLGSATYIEFLRRRLILARECLDSEGSIYVHIGHQMVGHVKVLMDEIFGASCYRNLITRRKCSSKNYTSRQFANIHDYILFYTKTNNYVWNQPGETPTEEWVEKEYPKVDKRGRYKLVPVHAPGVRNGETGKMWKGMLPPPGKHWQYTPEKLDQLDASGEIHWSKNGNPRRKVYLPKGKKVPYCDYLLGFRDAHHQSIKVTGYPTEKNQSLLEMLIGASTNPSDLVIDPFCGSGTTMAAAEQLGRNWIGIDESLAAIETAVQRLSKGSAPMGDYVGARRSNSKAMSVDDGNLYGDEQSMQGRDFRTLWGHQYQLYADAQAWEDCQDRLEKLL